MSDADTGQEGLAPAVEVALTKHNFMRLPVAIDAVLLLADYGNVPAGAWGISFWDVHCSIDVLLLRGGAMGEADDFTTVDVRNSPVLERMPYVAWLIGPDGPFGRAVYAFIFKTKANGITRMHRDQKEVWRRATRIHMPIVTNSGAFLLAEGRAKHLEVGEAWTFDNQSVHSVVNGDGTRVHLIIDVNPNPKLIALMRDATIDPGEPDPERWAKTRVLPAGGLSPLEVVEDRPLTPSEKRAWGLAEGGFATRVTAVNLKGRGLGMPLKSGDLIVAVDGSTGNAQSRSALDHIRVTCRPWQSIRLTIIRDGQQMERRLRLWPDYALSPRRFLAVLSQNFAILRRRLHVRTSDY